jgi:hypothetical protein
MVLFGSQYFILIIPIVVALFGWIGVVFWANIHPRVHHVGGPAAHALGADGLAAGAADEDAEPGTATGSVPQPRQRVAEAAEATEATEPAEPPSVPRQPDPARGDRTGSAPGR